MMLWMEHGKEGNEGTQRSAGATAEAAHGSCQHVRGGVESGRSVRAPECHLEVCQ